MSKTINIYDAKTHLSRLINMAMEGDEVVISKAGRPLVKLVPVMVKKQKRKAGLFKKSMVYSDDIDKPLDNEIVEDFYQ